MTHIIDRRLNAKDKSSVNRQRLLKRYQRQVKEAVEKAATERPINEAEKGSEVSISQSDVKEPLFRHGRGGQRTYVLPGNHEFQRGDKIDRPPSGAGQGGGDASDQGQGEDDFTFNISRDEYLDYLFEDLALPNMVKQNLLDADNFSTHQAGFSSQGSPEKLNVVRTLRQSQARRIALRGRYKRRIKELEEALALCADPERATELRAEIKRLKAKSRKQPFLDQVDLRYNNLVKVPKPSNAAVMFCIMDVSGSMTQDIKDIAKRYFLLLYLFLHRQYEKTEIVFVSHHTQAKEVDDETFFYARETGGTIVSTALHLTLDIIAERYAPENWNIYVAQASDGDNWDDDNQRCGKYMGQLLPLCQYFIYVEIGGREHQRLWRQYEGLKGQFEGRFAMRSLQRVQDIYPVFHELFQRQGVV
ncbi:MAG TPA: hypothetical protein DE179_06340 [Oceanospirillaceae bacterium]|nr:hypothetical protein [Oceanospirillaceae bacterium]